MKIAMNKKEFIEKKREGLKANSCILLPITTRTNKKKLPQFRFGVLMA